jgi:hypothetical protein
MHCFIAREPSVAQFDNALAVARVFFRMRHLHNRRPGAVELAKEIP